MPLDQGPAGSENGSMYPKPYEFGKVPLIDPERDILPIGGLIAVCDVGSGGRGTGGNGGVEKLSIKPPVTVNDPAVTGIIEPAKEPADNEWWCRDGTTGSDQDVWIPGKVGDVDGTAVGRAVPKSIVELFGANDE